jgi:hypothetical protein
MNEKSLNANNPLRITNSDCDSNQSNYPACSLPPDPKLVAAGWERRFIADARMVREAIATYKELGYEVRLEPFNTEVLRDECGGCKELFEKFSVIYTRKKKSK